VRFAEVNKSAIKEFRSQLATLNPHRLDARDNYNPGWVGSTNTGEGGGFADGVVDFGLFNANASIEVLIRFLTSKGLLKSLAEPNLIALPGREASFLAGGEFPYPAVQGGGGNNAVSIVFKEFGIRLKFTPTITRGGSIRLKVAPEVSALDFSNPLVFGGFTIPSLLTRRAETEVEMKNGQYLAIAGLVDNTMTDNATKIPILGDIPILGFFFKSTKRSKVQESLLIFITPRILEDPDMAGQLLAGEDLRRQGAIESELESIYGPVQKKPCETCDSKDCDGDHESEGQEVEEVEEQAPGAPTPEPPDSGSSGSDG
jgi:pilus assembly protein CpaC